jgi:hypothetical protein
MELQGRVEQPKVTVSPLALQVVLVSVALQTPLPPVVLLPSAITG